MERASLLGGEWVANVESITLVFISESGRRLRATRRVLPRGIKCHVRRIMQRQLAGLRKFDRAPPASHTRPVLLIAQPCLEFRWRIGDHDGNTRR